MKKLLVLLLSVCCALCLAFGIAGCKPDENKGGDNQTEQNGSVSQDPNGQNGSNDDTSDRHTEGLEFAEIKENDATVAYSVSKGTATDAEIIIPSSHENLPVTSIGVYAFRNCTGLKSIQIPDSVTSIGVYAFDYCTSLESITVDEKNTAYCCQDGMLLSKDKTELITAPATKSSVTIPDSVTSIGMQAFEFCKNLKDITIPEGVTSIGAFAFRNCTKLENITISGSVTYIGEDAFYNTAYYNKADNWTGDVLYIGDYLIKAKETLTGSYDITQGTKVIAFDAFRACGITGVNIPDSVTSICSHAFYNCQKLLNITIGNGVTSIGDSVFYKTAFYNTAESWTSDVLYIGNYLINAKKTIPGSCSITQGTKVIADNAFLKCTKLTAITIPDSVTYIGSLAFSGCKKLANATFANPDGWYYTSIFSETGADITKEDLQTTATAAKYLKNTYKNYIWKQKTV